MNESHIVTMLPRYGKRENVTYRGQQHHRTGTQHTEETREKMRLGSVGKNLGIKRSEETKKKISNSRVGKRHTEETKQKIRVALTGKNLGKIDTKKIKKKVDTSHTVTRVSRYGKRSNRKKHTEEIKEKIRVSQKLAWENRKLKLQKEKIVF